MSGPLSLFQAVQADKDGTFKLLSKLNNTLVAQSEPCQSENGLRILFDKLWPDFKEKLDQAPQVPVDAGPERSDSDVLAEILSKERMHSRLLVAILRSMGSFVPPIGSFEPSALALSKDDYVAVSFEELRTEALKLRKSGRIVTALEVFQKALSLNPEHLETLIDVAVTRTYLPSSVYPESIYTLEELVKKTAMEQASHPEASIIAKAYYNLACIKHIARRDQDFSCSDDEIFADLEQAFDRYPAYVNTALTDNDLLEMRNHARFKALVERYRRAER
ncbi:MAG TPA: hypothetical protein VE863_01235 [Pyrinomonadaceae bacterium]|nr:hypothetical protein [Pyrinomonadaceae bacterium]